MSEARAQILTVAARLFQSLGYDQTSTALIAKEAGLSNGSLFHAFAIKSAIRDALVLEARRSYAKSLNIPGQVVTGRPGELQRLVERVIGSHLSWTEANVDQAGLLYDLVPTMWLLDPTGTPPGPLQLKLVELQKAMRGSRRKVPDALLIPLVFGPAELASRTWLDSSGAEGSLAKMAKPFAMAAAGALGTIISGRLRKPRRLTTTPEPVGGQQKSEKPSKNQEQKQPELNL